MYSALFFMGADVVAYMAGSSGFFFRPDGIIRAGLRAQGPMDCAIVILAVSRF